MASEKHNRVVITGGGTYIGINLTSALLAEGASVTVIVREGNEARLGPLAEHVTIQVADVWDDASLRGRARGHGVVIHTVGSMIADPETGLTHKRLNLISARNAANMCISDGVPHFMLFSSANAPWMNRSYIRAKRDAEAYLKRVGLQASVIRAPLTYERGKPRAPFYQLMTLLGHVPPISWLGMRQIAPMPMDILARGVARIALNPQPGFSIYYASHLRRLNTPVERRGRTRTQREEAAITPSLPFEVLNEDRPFGVKATDHEEEP